MSVRGHISFFRALVATNLKATFALRGAFWMQVAFMAANNLVFFSVWWIFFDRFEEVGGWRLADMAALYGTVACSFGIAVVFFGGMRDLARTISDGDLDALLVQPKDPLLHAVGSRSIASGWGDLASGFLLLGISGYVSPSVLPSALVGIACGAVVFTASGVLFHSAAFWLGPVNDLARQVWEFVIAFSVNPPTVHGTFVRVILFTVLPAGFIGFLPAGVLRSFTWGGFLAVIAGAVAYALLAWTVFRRGLARYESGNRFGVRA